MRTRTNNRRSIVAALAVTGALAFSATACGSDDSTDDPTDIDVETPSDTGMLDTVPMDDGMIDDTMVDDTMVDDTTGG